MTATAESTITGRKIATGTSTKAHGHCRAKSDRGNTAHSENQGTAISSQATVASAIGSERIAGKWRSAAAHPAEGNASATAIMAKIRAARRALNSSGRLKASRSARDKTNARAA